MKIYATRHSSDDVVSYLQKFLDTDLWIKIEQTDKVTTYLAKITYIHKGKLTDLYFIGFEYIRYNLFEYIRSGGDIDSDIREVIHEVLSGFYTRSVPAKYVKICTPIEVYTTDEVKEILRYEE